MNSLTLPEIVRHYPLATKWLVGPSVRVASQWIESLVRSGQHAVNLRPTTIDRLAGELASNELIQKSLGLSSPWLATLAIESNREQLATSGYFGRLADSRSLPRLIADAIVTLRLANVDVRTVKAESIGNPDKLHELQLMDEAYRKFLDRYKLVDTADVLRMAIDSVGATLDPKSYVLIPKELHWTGLRRQLVDAIPFAQRIVVPAVAGDSQVHFARAIGESNEVRETLRQCVQHELPLDDVEIVCTDSETYIPLIFEHTQLYIPRANDETLPVTFADGLPAAICKPGKALQGWLAWIESNYSQVVLANLVADRLFVIEKSDDVSCTLLTRLLRPLAIGCGADHYLPKIDEQLASVKQRQQEAKKLKDDERLRALQRRHKAYRILRKLVSELLRLAAAFDQGSSIERLQVATQFLTSSARCEIDLDRVAHAELIKQILQRIRWYEQLNLDLDPRAFLQDLVHQTRVMSNGPKPGHLHVSHVESGGQSGRHRTFVLGMDDRRFPGALVQDAVLNDRDRATISDDLEVGSDRLRHKLDTTNRLLGKLSGDVTLSWSCRELIDDRESFPSPLVLSVYRASRGQENADMHLLEHAAGPPASFAPDAETKSLSESECWLWRLSESDSIGDQSALIHKFFSHLQTGAATAVDVFGDDRGCVAQAADDLNPFNTSTRSLSASALETLGRCPLAFFFRNALQIFPPEEMELDPDRWLDARDTGLLMHNVFRQFMAELAAKDQRPDFERDHARLAQILTASARQYRDKVPPPNENAYRLQYWQLIQIARVFLHEEAEFCQSSQPKFFEVALGVPSVDAGSPLDDQEPSTIDLPSGRSIRVRGQIDRVDQISEDHYSVWDYKLGSAWGFNESDPFRQGRKLQNVLYVAMVQQALRDKLSPTAMVDRFGYFFPGLRAQGLRVAWDADELASGMKLVDKLANTVAAGAFIATDNPDDCKFCDYQTICGDVQSVCAASKAVLDGSSLPVLNDFREVRRG